MNLRCVVTFVLFVSANMLAQTQPSQSPAPTQPTCPKGFQPYANRCISQRMADYISCVEASGGNSERIAYEVSNADAGKTGVDVKGSGSGMVIKGSGSVTVDRATEKALASRFEHTWTDKGMEECRKVLDPPKPQPHKSAPSASQGPCSSLQVGGSHNQSTVNCGPLSWKLSESNLKKLDDFAPNCVVSVATESDSKDLAVQLCSAGKDNHPRLCEGSGFGTLSSPQLNSTNDGGVVGLGCYGSDPEGVSLHAVQTSLKLVGLQCDYKGAYFIAPPIGFCTGMKAVVAIGNMPSKTLSGTEVPANGKVAFDVGNDSQVTLRDSQVAGYDSVVKGNRDIVDVERTEIQSSNDPLPQMPSSMSGVTVCTGLDTPIKGCTHGFPPGTPIIGLAKNPNPSGPNTTGGLYGITIRGPRYDLPLTPVPLGQEPSQFPIEEQRKIISAWAGQWKDDHPNDRVVRKQAIIWINQQLEIQNRDFRIEVPGSCPPAPGTIGFSAPSNTTGELGNVGLSGLSTGVAVGDKARIDTDKTSVIANDCD
jgi:hypothetical protein